MTETILNVLAVIGTLQRNSALRAVIEHLRDSLAGQCAVDILDFKQEPLALFDPETSRASPAYGALQARVERADVIILATPDYHGSVSSTAKNFLDHFWQEFAGKLFVSVVASTEKGLTVTDQLRTIARQCYAWSLPYGVSFTTETEIKDGQIASESLRSRLEMMTRDICVYGKLLSEQRLADLTGTDSGFLARYRK